MISTLRFVHTGYIGELTLTALSWLNIFALLLPMLKTTAAARISHSAEGSGAEVEQTDEQQGWSKRHQKVGPARLGRVTDRYSPDAGMPTSC